jgi:hypothetical protein
VLADGWGKRYGQRPCLLLRPEVRDPQVDAALDIACFHAGRLEESRNARNNGSTMPVYVVGG